MEVVTQPQTSARQYPRANPRDERKALICFEVEHSLGPAVSHTRLGTLYQKEGKSRGYAKTGRWTIFVA